MPMPQRMHPSYRPRTEPDPTRIAQAVTLLKQARRPVIYAGGGVINAGPSAAAALTKFARMTGFPVTNTLMGLGAYPGSDPQFLGMLGMHGTYEANLAMHGCDVLLNIGARFDDRVTGRLNAFSQGSRKIHADIDPSSINKNVPVDVAIVGDAGRVLEALIAEWNARRRQAGHPGDRPVVAADRCVARQGEPEVHSGHGQGLDHQAAIRHPAAV